MEMAIGRRDSYSSAGAFFALLLLFGILLKPFLLERVMCGGGVKWDVVRLRLKIFGNIVHVEPHVHVLAPLDPYIGKSTDTPELSPSSNSPTSPTQTPRSPSH